MQLTQMFLKLFIKIIFGLVAVRLFDDLPFIDSNYDRSALLDNRFNQIVVIDYHRGVGIHHIDYYMTLLDVGHRAYLDFA